MDNHVVDQRLSTYIASSSSSTYSALSFHSYSRAGIEVLCSPMYHPTSILQNDTKCICSKHIYIYVYIMNFYTPSNIIRIIYIYIKYVSNIYHPNFHAPPPLAPRHAGSAASGRAPESARRSRPWRPVSPWANRRRPPEPGGRTDIYLWLKEKAFEYAMCII